MQTMALALALLSTACPRDDAAPSAPSATTPARSAAGGDTPSPPAAAERVDEAADPPPADPSTPPKATVRLVDVDPAQGSLREQIVAATAKAKADGRAVAVELWAGWCPPCKKLDKLLRSGPVAEAASNAVLIRVDTDVFNDELTALGFDAPEIPTLYHVDDRGKPRGRTLPGGKWGKLSEAAIASQLAEFLRS